MIARYLGVLTSDPDQPFALQRLLDLYRQRDGNLDKLPGDITTRIAQGRAVYALLVVLGDVESARNDLSAARDAYQRAITMEPARPAALRALATLEIDKGNTPAGRELLERAVAGSAAGEPKRALLRKLAELALDANDYDAAAREFARLADGGGVYLAAEYARALVAKGEHQRAVDEYKRVLARLRGDARVTAPLLIELAKAQLNAGDATVAIETLQDARRAAGASGLTAEIDETRMEAYRRSGRLNELAEELAHRNSPNDLALLATIWDELGDTTRALDAYRRVLARQRNAIDIRLRVIALLSREGRIDDVVAEYRALVRVAPREPRFVTELAQLLMETGKRAEALKLLSSIAAQHPRDARLHEALAQLYTRWQEPERAAAELTLLTRIAPEDPMHLVVLGEQQIEQGDREAALATWRRILRVSDSKAKAHVTLGELLVDHDMLNEAVTEYREAIKLDDSDLMATRGLAEALERLHRDQEAATLWLRVIDLADDDRASRREARRRLIAIWARTNQLTGRLTEYARRFSITGNDANANDTEAGRFLAQGYERLARDRAPQAAHFRELSEQVARRIVELEPADTETLTSLEQMLAARGDLDGAIGILERLLLADPPRARAYLARMANYALQLYRDDQAIAYAERSVALNTDDAQAHQRLGDLYRARQNVEQAIAAYERAVKLNDRLFDANFVLAELYLARGQTAEADQHLRRVMRACPDDDFVARATRSSIQLHIGDGTLSVLEAELLPLALGHPQRPIFRRLAVELYDAMTQTIGPAQDNTVAVEIGKRAIKPLLEALADQDPEQQRTAVRILGQLDHAGAAVPLLALAESDTEMDLRRAALFAVGRVATDELAPRLGALAAGQHRRLRDVAAWALARLGTRSALTELTKLLDNSLPVVRVYAVLGLGRTGDARWTPRAVTLLHGDRSPSVRSAAAQALANLGGSSAITNLVASVRGPDEQVAAAAIVALGLLRDSQSANVLTDALFVANHEIQRHALWALQQLGQQPTGQRAPLIEPTALGEAELWSPDTSQVSWVLLNEVAQRFPEALTQTIRNALNGARETTMAALAALSDGVQQFDASQAKSPLAALLNTVDALPKVVAHPNRDVRIAALTLLAQIQSPEAAAALDAALDDREASVRAAALRLLRDKPNQAAADNLPQLLTLARQSPAWSMRLQAIATLGKLGGVDACAALVDALDKDEYAYVREQAATWIAQGCRASGRTALERAAHNDPEPRVRAAASAALSRL